MTEYKMRIRPYPLGAHCEEEGIEFSFVSAKENCGIIIYNKETGKRMEKIPFDPKLRIGDVHYCFLTRYSASQISYQFYEEDRIVPDENAAVFVGGSSYGKERKLKDLKAGFVTEEFDWQGDRRPLIPYEDCICYLLHVRGFTRHPSSRVSSGGTFRGITEKLSYLQEIGITTVELQPAYEFFEIPCEEERMRGLPYAVREEELALLSPKKLNYWGYKKGYYYAPKASYAAGDPGLEFKEMVREFHKRGMELIMQFYFPREITAGEIPEVLHYWLLEYHVDGFHLMGENLPADLFAQDPLLADCKLWYERFDEESSHFNSYYRGEEKPIRRNLAVYQEDYLYTMRKFLKGDENMVNQALFQMRHNPQKCGRIHYMSNYHGMTLMDMVSYDRKHNEDNGEDNRDGNDCNCTWNCGEEGYSRRKKVISLRKRQLKNAMCLLLLSQSTPLIFMGDEFGNSQKGNNNPYCQDNAVAWLDWRDAERKADFLAFWKQLVAARKAHPILHLGQEMKIMDYIACGYPDLSYHGQNPWRPETESYSRCVGIMYCGKYARVDRTKEDDFFYAALNMHWEPHEFGLPKLPKGLKWEQYLTTYEEKRKTETAAVGTAERQKKENAAEALLNTVKGTEREPENHSGRADGQNIVCREMTVIQEGQEKGTENDRDGGKDNSSELRPLVQERTITVFRSVPDENKQENNRKKSTVRKTL